VQQISTVREGLPRDVWMDICTQTLDPLASAYRMLERQLGQAAPTRHNAVSMIQSAFKSKSNGSSCFQRFIGLMGPLDTTITLLQEVHLRNRCLVI